MAKSIEDNATLILQKLAEMPREEADKFNIDGTKVQALTGLTPDEINDSVTILEESGYVQLYKNMGTAPYNFGVVEITPRGRYENERVSKAHVNHRTDVSGVTRPPPQLVLLMVLPMKIGKSYPPTKQANINST